MRRRTFGFIGVLSGSILSFFGPSSTKAQTPAPIGNIVLPPGDTNSFGSSSARYNNAGGLYDWDGENVFRLDGSVFTNIGHVAAGNSADPGPINFSSDGQTILLGNGGGGQLGGSSSGQIFSLPLSGGTTNTPVGNVANNFDFVPVPASSAIAGSSTSKYFVNGSASFGSNAVVSVFDSTTGSDVSVISVPGASASMTLDPTNQRLYVENGYTYSPADSYSGEIRSFTLDQIDQAIVNDKTLDFSSGRLFNVVAGNQNGAGLFFDKNGFLIAGGGNDTFTDGGVTAFNPDGSVARFTDFGFYTSVLYNPALDQVVTGDGSIYDAQQFEPEPATLGVVAFAGLLLIRRKPRKPGRRAVVAVAAAMSAAPAAFATGPYSPAGGQLGSTAVSASSSSIVEWASGATINRGLRNIENPTEYGPSGSAANFAFFGGSDGASIAAGATSSANAAPVGAPPQPQSAFYSVALGQGGSATLTFAQPIANGAGADFAVFGNGFSTLAQEWCKPAFVEVSSDGVHFFRFPSISLTPATSQVGSYSEIDPTNLYNLAGKDPAGWGTPFDLSELIGVSANLDVNDVTQVRIVSCTDDINPAFASLDSQGNIINGPWPSASSLGSEGFDLAGVGVLNDAPEPAGSLAATASICVLLSRRKR